MQLGNSIAIFLFILLFILLWGWTVMRAYRFIWSREPELLDRLFWLALVIVLPLVGYAVFRIAFSLTRVFTVERSASSEAVFQTDVQRPTDFPPQSILGSAMMPAESIWLAVVDGPAQGKQIWVSAFPAVIGRGSEASIRLDEDSSISRHNTELSLDDGHLVVRDLGSRHGTRVNGRPVREGKVKPGDRIELGATTIVIQAGGSA